jgi:Na+-driven multidrug efflux pump
MLCVSVFFFLFSEPLIDFVNTNASAQQYAIQAIHIVSLGYVFYGVGMVMMNAFNGAGDTKTPTLINLFGFWMFQIPVAYLLALHLNYGPKGVFIAIVSSETLITIISLLIFKRGRWKLVKV